MKLLLKNPAVYAVLAYCLLFVTSIWTFGSIPVKSLIDYGVLAVSLLFFFKWLPNAWEAFKSGGIERKFRLSLGLALMAAGLAGQRIWIIAVNQLGVPDVIDKDAVSAFIGSWFAASMILCLSIDTEENSLASQLKWYYTAIALGFGIILGFFVATAFFN